MNGEAVKDEMPRKKILKIVVAIHFSIFHHSKKFFLFSFIFLSIFTAMCDVYFRHLKINPEKEKMKKKKRSLCISFKYVDGKRRNIGNALHADHLRQLIISPRSFSWRLFDCLIFFILK